MKSKNNALKRNEENNVFFFFFFFFFFPFFFFFSAKISGVKKVVRQGIPVEKKSLIWSLLLNLQSMEGNGFPSPHTALAPSPPSPTFLSLSLSLSLSLEEHQGNGFQVETENGLHMGDHQNFLASSLNAISLSLPGMISLSDPIWRWHNTI